MAAITRLGLHGVTFINYGNFNKIDILVEDLDIVNFDVFILKIFYNEVLLTKTYSTEVLL